MMEILLTLAYIALGVVLIEKLPFFSSSELGLRWLKILFLCKVGAGVSLGLLYTYYYTDRSTADVYKYFDDAKVIFSSLQDSPLDYLRLITGIDGAAPSLEKYYQETNYWFKQFDYRLYNDNRTIIRFNAIVMLFSGKYFFVHTVVLCFLSFLGTFCIYRFFESFSSRYLFPLSIATFMVPSFLFWSSGLLKEGLLLFAQGVFVFNFYKIVDERLTLQRIVLVMLSLFILAITKYYVLACAVPAVLFLIVSRFKVLSIATWAILIHVLILLVALFNNYVPIGFDVFETLALKRNDYIHFMNSLDSVGSRLTMHLVAPSIWSFIVETPQALYNSFLLPLPWHLQSPLFVMPIVENLMLFCLVLMAIKLPLTGKYPIRMILFSFSFGLVLYWLSGLITPVLGSLVRYKVPAMPFIYAGLVCMIEWNLVLGEKLAVKLERFAQQ